ncbi:hypothetical protein DFJ74DRAFT_733204, partial [Hyaloraphidium curvatum]
SRPHHSHLPGRPLPLRLLDHRLPPLPGHPLAFGLGITPLVLLRPPGLEDVHGGVEPHPPPPGRGAGVGPEASQGERYRCVVGEGEGEGRGGGVGRGEGRGGRGERAVGEGGDVQGGPREAFRGGGGVARRVRGCGRTRNVGRLLPRRDEARERQRRTVLVPPERGVRVDRRALRVERVRPFAGRGNVDGGAARDEGLHEGDAAGVAPRARVGAAPREGPERRNGAVHRFHFAICGVCWLVLTFDIPGGF